MPDADVQSVIALLSDLQLDGPIRDMITGLRDAVSEAHPIFLFMVDNVMSPFTGADITEWHVMHDLPKPEYYNAAKELATVKHEGEIGMSLKRANQSLAIVYYRTDRIRNMGKDKQRDFVATRIDMARKGFGATQAVHLYGDGTNDPDGNALDPDGFQPLIGFGASMPTDPTTGTYGGQSRVTYSAIRSNQVSIADLDGLTIGVMDEAVSKATHVGEGPNLITMSAQAFRKFKARARAEGYKDTNKKAIDLGFPNNIAFGGIPVIPDPAMSATTDSGLLTSNMKAVFIHNTNQYEWHVDPNDDLLLEEPMQRTDQHTYVQYIYWSGQFVNTNPRYGTRIWWT